MLNDTNCPKMIECDLENGMLKEYTRTMRRRVSDLAASFADTKAVEHDADRIVYESFIHDFVTDHSDMALGVTRLYPGRVGKQYFLTKGHFHESATEPEIYICLRGTGYILLENRENDRKAWEFSKGKTVHIPGSYAHRTVNTGSSPLIFLSFFHLSAGHNYADIEKKGFSQSVVEENGVAVVVDRRRGQ